MEIENEAQAKCCDETKTEATKASESLMDDVLGGQDLDEGRRRRNNGYPFQPFPLHIERPKSVVSGLQYEVRDGNITIKGRSGKGI